MLTKIKEFLFGKPAEVATAPYKVEIVPLGTEATMASPTPAELKLVAEITDAIHDTDKPVKAPVAKPKAAPKPKVAAVKAPAKPRAPAKSRAPKTPK
jgi:DNA replication initiation complex subunit (GINS family)